MRRVKKTTLCIVVVAAIKPVVARRRLFILYMLSCHPKDVVEYRFGKPVYTTNNCLNVLDDMFSTRVFGLFSYPLTDFDGVSKLSK